MITTLMGTGNM